VFKKNNNKLRRKEMKITKTKLEQLIKEELLAESRLMRLKDQIQKIMVDAGYVSAGDAADDLRKIADLFDQE
tara:strand:- start:324 stop:539 length:216 start_codon:yes stop_codon:yes gene_type:complete